MTTTQQQQRHTEPNANFALGELLKAMLPNCEVRSEQTRTVRTHSGRRPDILITAPGRSPVVVEAEYEPASEAEPDAQQRLGLPVSGEGEIPACAGMTAEVKLPNRESCRRVARRAAGFADAV